MHNLKAAQTIPDLIKMHEMTKAVIAQIFNAHSKTVIEDMTFSHFIAQDYLGKRNLGIFYTHHGKLYR